MIMGIIINFTCCVIRLLATTILTSLRRCLAQSSSRLDSTILKEMSSSSLDCSTQCSLHYLTQVKTRTRSLPVAVNRHTCPPSLFMLRSLDPNQDRHSRFHVAVHSPVAVVGVRDTASHRLTQVAQPSVAFPIASRRIVGRFTRIFPSLSSPSLRWLSSPSLGRCRLHCFGRSARIALYVGTRPSIVPRGRP